MTAALRATLQPGWRPDRGGPTTDGRSGRWAAPPVAVAPLPVVGAPVPAGVVPAAGILVGGTVTATARAGRRALDELESRAVRWRRSSLGSSRGTPLVVAVETAAVSPAGELVCRGRVHRGPVSAGG